jgi:hypothetical protein
MDAALTQENNVQLLDSSSGAVSIFMKQTRHSGASQCLAPKDFSYQYYILKHLVMVIF